MKKNYKGGFTLIELLVVIAIIGILASVVLASLNTARDKGADAKVKAEVSNARAQAEIFYDTNQSYSNVCAGANGVSALISSAAKASMGSTAIVGATAQVFTYNSAVAGGAVCHDSISGWAAIVSLKRPSTASSGWCVDSTGTAKEVTALSANSVVCGS